MRELKNIKNNETDLVAVSNTYAMSKKMSLTPLATRLFVWCISQIKKTDVELVPFTITSSEFARSFGSTNVRRDLDRITDELMNFQIRLQGDDGSFSKIVAMPSCSYDATKKVAVLNFSAEMWNCFTQLNGGKFASGSLQIFTQINSRFAFNLYIYLHQHIKSGTNTIDILDLGEFLGALEPTYAKWAQLNSKILKPLKEAFDEHSPVKFDYRPAGKVGRKFTQVQFFNIKKGPVQGQLVEKPNPFKKVETQSDDEKSAKQFYMALSAGDKLMIKETLKAKGEPAAVLEYDPSTISALANHPELIEEGVLK
ncbi:MAG: replication initiation protein [Lentisphaeraceae bacterium]|nr:replication initiation protein [Lentisphaeraceae bacterium]